MALYGKLHSKHKGALYVTVKKGGYIMVKIKYYQPSTINYQQYEVDHC